MSAKNNAHHHPDPVPPSEPSFFGNIVNFWSAVWNYMFGSDNSEKAANTNKSSDNNEQPIPEQAIEKKEGAPKEEAKEEGEKHAEAEKEETTVVLADDKGGHPFDDGGAMYPLGHVFAGYDTLPLTFQFPKWEDDNFLRNPSPEHFRLATATTTPDQPPLLEEPGRPGLSITKEAHLDGEGNCCHEEEPLPQERGEAPISWGEGEGSEICIPMITHAGQIVYYTITVTNTGEVTLFGVDITDQVENHGIENLLATINPIISGDNGDGTTSLGVGESWIFETSYTVTQADIDNNGYASGEGQCPDGTLDNVASASTIFHFADGDFPVTFTDTASVPICYNPDISIDKSVCQEGESGTKIQYAGQEIHYQIVVTNTGNVTLAVLDVSDHVESDLFPHSLSNPSIFNDNGDGTATLGVGEVWTYKDTYIVKQEDIDQNGYGYWEGGDGYLKNNAVVIAVPNITADCQQETPPLIASDCENVPICYNPSIDIDKSVCQEGEQAVTVSYAGQEIHYQIVVTNTGNVTLTVTSLTDEIESNGAHSLSNLISIANDNGDGTATLGVGESWTYKDTYTVTQADINQYGYDYDGFLDNTAEVTATDTHGNEVSDDDSALVPILYLPNIDIEKSVCPDDGSVKIDHAGQYIHYLIKVTNTGNVDFISINLTDLMENGVQPVPQLINNGDGDSILDVGETWVYKAVYQVTQNDIDKNGTFPGESEGGGEGEGGGEEGPNEFALFRFVDQDPIRVTDGILSNIASVTGMTSNGHQLTDVDDAEVPICYNPDISIDKSILSPESISTAGEVIHYQIVVENTGNVTFTSVDVTDEIETDGLSAVLFFNNNDATVTGDTANDGVLTMSPGEKWTFTFDHTVTQADIDNNGYDGDGELDNLATVTGKTENGNKETDQDDASVPIIFQPSIDIDKSVCGDNVKVSYAGQQIAYKIIVTNTGNVTMSDVSVTDEIESHGSHSLLNPISIDNDNGDGTATLGVGESWTFKDYYTVTQADINANGYAGAITTLRVVDDTPPPIILGDGFLDNIATVDAKDPKGDHWGDDDSASVPICYNPDIMLVKNAEVIGGGPIDSHLDIVKYTIAVTNTGNVDLTNVVLHDTLENGHTVSLSLNLDSKGNGDGILNVGETWNYSVNFTDLAIMKEILETYGYGNGLLTNNADVTADDTQGGQVSDTDSAEVPVASNPALTILKEASVPGGTVNYIGETITYKITVTNTGNVDLTNVVLTDQIESYGATILNSYTESLSNNNVLNVGETWVYTTTYNVTASDITNQLAGDKDMDNKATVDTDQTNPQDASASVPIGGCDLTILKTASDSTPDLGETFTFTLKVTNNGPDALPAGAIFNITDDLTGTGITFVSANNGGSYSAATNTITWSLNTGLGSGASTNVSFTAKILGNQYEIGTTNPAFPGGEQAAWNKPLEVKIGGYSLGTNIFASGDIFSGTAVLTANAKNVTPTVDTVLTYGNVFQADAGVGVQKTGQNSPSGLTPEIDFIKSAGQTESFIAKLLNPDIDYATIKLSSLGGGELGTVTAFDANGNQVGGPVYFHGTTDGNETDSVTISVGSNFSYLVFQGLQSTSGGDSSFYVEDIQYSSHTNTNVATVSLNSPYFETNLNNNSDSETVTPKKPIAQCGGEEVQQGLGKINLLIVLDRSGSMDNKTSDSGGLTKLAIAKQAIEKLLLTYGQEGQVSVKMVAFSTSSTIMQTQWVSITQALSDLNSLTADGRTNYDAALGLTPNGTLDNFNNGAEQAINDGNTGYIQGGQNFLYFLSDGGPNEPDGSAGINPNFADNVMVALNTTEEEQWQGVLNGNNNLNADFKAFSIAVGLASDAKSEDSQGSNDSTIKEELDPIQNQNGTIFVPNVSNLTSALVDTVSSHAGNILTETNSSPNSNAPGGYLKSVAIIGENIVFNFDGANTVTVAGPQAGSANYSYMTGLLTINDDFGKLEIYLKAVNGHNLGDYVYTAPASLSGELTVPIEFDVANPFNEIATGVLTLQVVPPNETSSDDYVLTNNDDKASVIIPDYALLWNDNSQGGDMNVVKVLDPKGNDTLARGTANTTYDDSNTSDGANPDGFFDYYAETNGHIGFAHVVVDFAATLTTPSDSKDYIMIAKDGTSNTLTDTATHHGDDVLLGGTGADTLNAGDGFDLLYGRGGNDILNGGIGFTVMRASTGNDTYNGNLAGTSILDFTDRTAGFTFSLGTNGNGSFSTGSGIGNGTYTNIDGMMGTKFNDVLSGNILDNFIFSNGGSDTLWGGHDNNALTNGGSDTFVFTTADANGGNHTVSIQDFDAKNAVGSGNQGDVLDLTKLLHGVSDSADNSVLSIELAKYIHFTSDSSFEVKPNGGFNGSDGKVGESKLTVNLTAGGEAANLKAGMVGDPNSDADVIKHLLDTHHLKANSHG